MKQTLILGNIITMDEKRPAARAALIKDGVFAYIGDAETAKRLAGPRTRRCWTTERTSSIPASWMATPMGFLRATARSGRRI